MSRKLASFLALVIIASLLLAACGGAATSTETVKVGAIFDLTGATGDVGTPYAEGVQGYVKWLNDKGGVDGRNIDLVFQDYAYKVDVAEQLYTQFVQEGVVAFMGWGTGDTEALRGRIAEDKIPFMSASYSHVLGTPSEAPFNFLLGTSYSDQFFIAMDWIMDDWQGRGSSGAPVMALMHHNSAFGLSPWEQGGMDYAAKLGISATAYPMPAGATDFIPELTRIRDSGAQYVVFQTVSSPAATALKDAASLGMSDVTFICLNWCADEGMINLAGDAAEGVIGTLPFTPPTVDVPGMADARAYLQSQGSSLDDKGVHYIQGWTTMALMTEGIRKAAGSGEVSGDAVRAALETLKDYDTGGVTSSVTFTSSDHRGTKALRLYKVEGGKWTQLTDFKSAQS